MRVILTSVNSNIHKMRTILIIVLLTIIRASFPQETEDCRCVAYYLCNKTTGVIIDDGEGIIGERLGSCTCDCPRKQNPKQVCCRLNSNVTTTRGVDSAIPCGFRNPDGVGNKAGVGGEDINFGEFPWFVDILVDSGISRCSGALIHPSVVLTAAHCVARTQTYIVRAGEWDNSHTDELFKHQDLRVTSKKIHAEYNPAVYYNDVALLFVGGAFNLTKHIQPVCLPPTDVALSNERCYVVGRAKDAEGQYPAIPKRVDMSLADRGDCNAKLRQTKLGQSFHLHRSALCAGGEKGKDACLGDGGGPLVCPIVGKADQYQQVGVVSWGLGCREEGLPGVYTNISYLRKWIDDEMADRNLKTSQYTY